MIIFISYSKKWLFFLNLQLLVIILVAKLGQEPIWFCRRDWSYTILWHIQFRAGPKSKKWSDQQKTLHPTASKHTKARRKKFNLKKIVLIKGDCIWKKWPALTGKWGKNTKKTQNGQKSLFEFWKGVFSFWGFLIQSILLIKQFFDLFPPLVLYRHFVIRFPPIVLWDILSYDFH